LLFEDGIAGVALPFARDRGPGQSTGVAMPDALKSTNLSFFWHQRLECLVVADVVFLDGIAGVALPFGRDRGPGQRTGVAMPDDAQKTRTSHCSGIKD
jgi:hypothetical protein